MPASAHPLGLTRLALLATLLGTSACGTMRATMDAYATGPHGIARPQQQLRDALADSDFPRALAWREDDDLLRELAVGVSSYYALQFARSAAVLDSAALLADDRITTSVSGNALALLTNDMARPYQPRRTERLFIPYYGMMSYARTEQWEDAAVEARRLGALLAAYAGDRTDAERQLHATLHYLTGVVFERAGERDEAQVAYRLAQSLVRDTDALARRTPTASGDVVVVVERGFVAHRATETINLFLGEDDRDQLHAGEEESTSRLAARVADRIDHPSPSDRSRIAAADVRHGHHGPDADAGYWVSVAFPSVRRGRPLVAVPDVLVDGGVQSAVRLTSRLDDATESDAARERKALVIRAVTRAAAKYAVAKAVKDKHGEVAGSIANIGASLLERADIRSWHLLPQEITILRIHAVPGSHELQLDPGSGAPAVSLGTINVRAGSTVITTVRLWREPVTPTLASHQ
ncbi:MAG: hypothetical protein ABJA80_01865 [bacterium]